MNKFNESIDDEFEKAYFFFHKGKFILDNSFKQATFAFFDKYNNAQSHWEIHDHFFENFGPFWHKIESGQIILLPKEHIEKVFEKILGYVYEWEDNNNPNKIHKGTIYYFYGMICILNGEIEKGCLLMHQASDEDGNLNRPVTPSKSFISLDENNPNQFFLPKVRETVTFLQKYIDKYNSITSRTFTKDDLRTKFLVKDDYKEAAFFFVYSIYKLENIYNRLNKRIRDNTLASFIETTIVFEFCKLFECLLGKFYSSRNLIMKINNFCQDSQVNLNLRQANLHILNEERDRDFSNTISNLINCTYTHNSFLQSPSDIEYDLALTYALRNFGGHKIEDQNILRENFEKIIEALMNSIFLLIDYKF